VVCIGFRAISAAPPGLPGDSSVATFAAVDSFDD
jgi:hypothetical protein